MNTIHEVRRWKKILSSMQNELLLNDSQCKSMINTYPFNQINSYKYTLYINITNIYVYMCVVWRNELKS